VQSSTAWREIPFSLLALLILFILVNDSLLFRKEANQLGRVDALIMLAFFLLFLYYAFRQLKNDKAITVKREQESIISSKKIVLLLIAGMAGLISGGKLVLDNSVKLAIELGLSEKIIGLTIVAAGTSLPELATSLVAIIKKNNDLAVGNIIGSNIFNILFILPVSSLIRPLQFNPAFNLDISFIAFGTLVLFIAMYTGKRKQIDRWEVFVLLICYALYMIYMLK
jgi:cation:H+ antiporter